MIHKMWNLAKDKSGELIWEHVGDTVEYDDLKCKRKYFYGSECFSLNVLREIRQFTGEGVIALPSVRMILTEKTFKLFTPTTKFAELTPELLNKCKKHYNRNTQQP